MKKSRFSDEQIVYAIKRVEAGVPIAEICKEVRDHPADLLSLEEEVRRTPAQ